MCWRADAVAYVPVAGPPIAARLPVFAEQLYTNCAAEMQRHPCIHQNVIAGPGIAIAGLMQSTTCQIVSKTCSQAAALPGQRAKGY